MLVTTIVLGVGIGVLAQPQLIVRFMTVKSNMELNRAVLVGGVFIFMMTGAAFIVGSLSNEYFFNHPEFASISLLAANNNPDKIIPLYINNAMPQWFTVIFTVTLLAAVISTLSSQFHVMGTAIGRDIYEKWIGGKGKTIIITRVGIAVAIIVSLFSSWGLPSFYEGGTAIIARGTAIFFGLCASAFLPMYIGSLYSKSIKKISAISGFITGFSVSLFWLLFIHLKESQPLLLCKAIFGTDSLAGETLWKVIDPLVVALPISIIVTIATNCFGKPLSE